MERLPEEWEVEGALENMLGAGIDLLYYLDSTHGVFVYKLLTDNQIQDERTFYVANPDDRETLDEINALWTQASLARAADDTLGSFQLTWDGLRVMFPSLPEVLMTFHEGRPPE